MRARAFDPVLATLLAVTAAAGAFVVWDAAFPIAILRGQGIVPIDLVKHVLGLGVGFIAFLVFGSMGHARLASWGKWLYAGAFLLCALILVPGVGKDLGTGAYRWIGFGSLSIQPAELMKPATLIFLALWIRRKMPEFAPRYRNFAERMDGRFVPWFVRFLPLFVVLVSFVLIEKEPDLGTAVVVLAIAFGLLVFGLADHLFGKQARVVVIGVVAFCVVGAMGMAVTKGYRVDRMAAHSNRWDRAHIDGAGYQPAQAELAMAVGGPGGVGIAQGRAKHVLPAATTDFVCVTPFEEFGLIGVLVVVFLLGGITLRLIYLGTFIDDPFRRLLVQGTGWWIGVQSIANLLMAGAAIPAVGIPLPFFSYGNSSLLALGIALGMCKSAMSSKRSEAEYASGRHRRRHRRPRLSRA